MFLIWTIWFSVNKNNFQEFLSEIQKVILTDIFASYKKKIKLHGI